MSGENGLVHKRKGLTYLGKLQVFKRNTAYFTELQRENEEWVIIKQYQKRGGSIVYISRAVMLFTYCMWT